MKNLKLKTTETSAMAGFAMIANPKSKLGYNGISITYEIKNIPDDIDNLKLQKLFMDTIIVPSNLFSFDYNQLGVGKIIK
jgi:hypothetical protein